MAKLTLETENGEASVNIADDATIYTYANAFINLLMFATFTEHSVEQLFDTTYFDDGE